MRYQNLLDSYCIKRFTEPELFQGKNVPEELWENSIPTVLLAEHMRNHLGFPITVSGDGNGGYRTWEDHLKVYEKINKDRLDRGKEPIKVPEQSMHLLFNAFDLCPVSGKLSEVFQMKDFLLKQPYRIKVFWKKEEITIHTGITGIGVYSWGVHLDTRGLMGRKAPARW